MRLTLRLLLVGCDGAYKVLGRHVDLGVSVLAYDLQRGKVAENLVWSGVGPNSVLILHHLPNRQKTAVNDMLTLGMNTAPVYPNINRIKEPAISGFWVLAW